MKKSIFGLVSNIDAVERTIKYIVELDRSIPIEGALISNAMK